jgi:hypothetical protein
MNDERISDNQIAMWDALSRAFMPVLRRFNTDDIVKALGTQEHVNTITPDQVAGWDYAYRRAMEFSNTSTVRNEVIEGVKDYVVYAEDLNENEILQVQTVSGTKRWVGIPHQGWGAGARVITPAMTGANILAAYAAVTDHGANNRYTFVIMPGQYYFASTWFLEKYKDVVFIGEPELIFTSSGLTDYCIATVSATSENYVFSGSPQIKVSDPTVSAAKRFHPKVSLIGFSETYFFKVDNTSGDNLSITWIKNPSGLNLGIRQEGAVGGEGAFRLYDTDVSGTVTLPLVLRYGNSYACIVEPEGKRFTSTANAATTYGLEMIYSNAGLDADLCLVCVDYQTEDHVTADTLTLPIGDYVYMFKVYCRQVEGE